MSKPKKPLVGELAPGFRVQVTGGDYGEEGTVSLADLAGQEVVLYFYPKDSTPGCTTQACDLRDRWGEVCGKAKVFGVSPDSIKSHQAFLRKQGLPFPLISDPDKVMIEAYGCWVEKSLYGRLGFGTERSSLVIGRDQRIKAVLEKVKPKDHVNQLLAVLG